MKETDENQPGKRTQRGKWEVRSESQTTKELFFLSTILFTFSALFLQIILNGWVFWLLRRYHISFSASLFSIDFAYFSEMKWSFIRIMLVFASGPVLMLLAGFWLLKLKIVNWRLKLARIWLTLLMINTLPLSIIYGAFIYKGFGMAMIWLIPELYIRAIIAIATIILLIFTRPFWLKQFLRSTYSSTVYLDEVSAREYLSDSFTWPGIAGSVILLLFAVPHLLLPWTITITGLSFVFLPIYQGRLRLESIRIHKSGSTTILSDTKVILYYGLLLCLLWAASWLTITF